MQTTAFGICLTRRSVAGEGEGMSEHEALKEMVKSLWGRVRMLEMIVIRQSDNMETSSILHGVRGSLYETSEYYKTSPDDSFERILQELMNK